MSRLGLSGPAGDAHHSNHAPAQVSLPGVDSSVQATRTISALRRGRRADLWWVCGAGRGSASTQRVNVDDTGRPRPA